METATQTLTDFLLARIAEDEAEARAAAIRDYGTANPPRFRNHPHWATYEWNDYEGGLTNVTFEDSAERTAWLAARLGQHSNEETPESRHIMRHDPARVLAECEAKRRIVKDFTVLLADYRVTHDQMTEARRFQAAVSMGHLAAVYADHPDYREEWRP